MTSIPIYIHAGPFKGSPNGVSMISAFHIIELSQRLIGNVTQLTLIPVSIVDFTELYRNRGNRFTFVIEP